MDVLKIKGRCVIKDQNGNIVLDKENDIHPGNMARSIARALAHESNYWVHSIVYGDGATYKYNGVSVHRTPNDGIAPDLAGWRSDIYHAVHREVVDDQSVGWLGVGEGADVELNPPAYEHDINSTGVISVDDGRRSRIVVNTSLNFNEPFSQQDTGKDFTFDEIALYTGISPNLWNGYQLVDVSINFNSEKSGLEPDTNYVFDMKIGGVVKNCSIITPKIGTGIDGAISYYDVLQLLNAVTPDVVVDVVDLVKVKDAKQLKIIPRVIT